MVRTMSGSVGGMVQTEDRRTAWGDYDEPLQSPPGGRGTTEPSSCESDSPAYYSTPSSSSGIGSGGSSAYGCPSASSSGNNNSNNNGNVGDGSSNPDESEHIYEDIVVEPPHRLPKITGGILNKDKTAVVRPVAFKPVQQTATTTAAPSPYPTSHRIATPINVPIRNADAPSTGENHKSSAYIMSNNTGSLKLSLLRSSQFSLSQNSLCFDNSGEPDGNCLKTPSSFVSSPSTKMLSGSYLHLDELGGRQNQTPSPSDSGIAELEAMLKEKDSEINYLRETLEQNEQVIFKVFEEKQHNWKKELGKIRAQYENRLKMCQQRALKMEQLLMNQSYQLQQEKRKQTSAYDRMRKDKEVAARQISDLRKEVDGLKVQLEETRWSVCQKSGEISLFKSQLKECQIDQSNKANEIIVLKGHLKEARTESVGKVARLSDMETENSRLRKEVEDGKSRLEQCLRDLKMTHDRTTLSDLQLQNEKLRIQFMDAKRAIDYERGSHENERINWLEEKEKVIRYQKQLQLNYVQMFRRNHSLEHELEQLTLELDHRDYRTIGESNC